LEILHSHDNQMTAFIDANAGSPPSQRTFF
jgi:hypothetical protein